MNILMVTERYIPIWGGAENQLRQLIPHLIAKGCSVEIVTRRWHPEMVRQKDIDGVTVYRLGIPGNTRFATVVFVVALLFFFLKKGKYVDIYHSHGAVNMGAICRVAAKVQNRKNVTKIASAGKIPALKNSLVGKLALAMFKKSNAIICMTAEIRSELAAINTAEKFIYRLTNGVDGKRFHRYSNEKRTEWKEAQGLIPTDRVILFSSRIVSGKGLDILLAGWNSIYEQYPDCWLFVVGSGKDQPDSIEPQMKSLADKDGLQRVRFVGETDTPEFYLGVADLFVFPSRHEGFPNALMEAMAAGLPVLASRIGGVTDLVEENVTAVLFESENSDDLARQLISCLTSPDLLETIGKQARLQMLKKYSFESIASQYVSLYENLLGKD
ncbi:MAG TPA: glycosyltransferase family 1 protein [Desulfobacterales bacterium]|nr:glycosyltransferase family 1 protein [Desulfobacterales bacterium]